MFFIYSDLIAVQLQIGGFPDLSVAAVGVADDRLLHLVVGRVIKRLRRRVFYAGAAA